MKRCNHSVALSCQILLLLIISAIISQAQTDTSAEIRDLIGQLENESKAWSASVKLQKMGGEAITALISNLKVAGNRNKKHTLATLKKMGPPAIPYIVNTFLACTDEPYELKHERQDKCFYKSTLIDALAAMGPDAIPGLVQIAEASPSNQYYGREYHHYAFEAILRRDSFLDPVQPLPDQWNNPWLKISPASFEVLQRKKAVQPFLLQIHGLMVEDHKYWKLQNFAPEINAAFILALWGKDELKQAGIDMLLQMANASGKPWYHNRDLIDKLICLGIKSAASLLKSNLPHSDYEYRDQELVSTAKQLLRIGDPDFFKIILPAFNSKELVVRKDAIAFAEQSHDLRFVPILISKLKDRTLTGGGVNTHKQVIADLALRALQHLSFESFPMDAKVWKAWWSANSGTKRDQLLKAYLASCMESFDRTPVWQLNSWIDQLRGVYDPAVLPLLARYIRHPQLDTLLKDSSGRKSYVVQGLSWIEHYGIYDPFPWGWPPEVVTILIGIAAQGNKEARRLLDSCLISNDLDVRVYGAIALTGFHSKPAIVTLRQEAAREESISAVTAVEALVKLGDSQAIGLMIEKIAADQQRDRDYSRSQDFELLLRYTQENIRFTPTMKLWRNWWKQHHSDFKTRLIQAEIDERFDFHVAVSP
jgi:hypothetical protein